MKRRRTAATRRLAVCGEQNANDPMLTSKKEAHWEEPLLVQAWESCIEVCNRVFGGEIVLMDNSSDDDSNFDTVSETFVGFDVADDVLPNCEVADSEATVMEEASAQITCYSWYWAGYYAGVSAERTRVTSLAYEEKVTDDDVSATATENDQP